MMSRCGISLKLDLSILKGVLGADMHKQDLANSKYTWAVIIIMDWKKSAS
jgi:hypothetical protein